MSVRLKPLPHGGWESASHSLRLRERENHSIAPAAPLRASSLPPSLFAVKHRALVTEQNRHTGLASSLRSFKDPRTECPAAALCLVWYKGRPRPEVPHCAKAKVGHVPSRGFPDNNLVNLDFSSWPEKTHGTGPLRLSLSVIVINLMCRVHL